MPYSTTQPVKIDVSPLKLAARVISNAENMVELVGQFPIRIGAVNTDESSLSKPTRFPASILVEIDVVLKLNLWELGDLTECMDSQRPMYAESFRAIIRRDEKGGTDCDTFTRLEAEKLSTRVFRVWLDRYMLVAPHRLGVDAVAERPHEDTFIEHQATFLWQHRHLVQPGTDAVDANPQEKKADIDTHSSSTQGINHDQQSSIQSCRSFRELPPHAARRP